MNEKVESTSRLRFDVTACYYNQPLVIITNESV